MSKFILILRNEPVDRTGLSAEIESLAKAGALQGYLPLHATKAEMLRRLGRTAEAITSLQAALGLAVTAPTSRLLQRRLDDLTHLACSTGAR